MFSRTARCTLRTLACRPFLSRNPLTALVRSLPDFFFQQQQQRANMASAVAKRLSGKTILITGASSGIGRSTALEFARSSPQDLRLILTARRTDELEKLAAEITKEVGAGVKVLPVQFDVSKPAEVRGFVGSLPGEWRDIDVLVNNA